MGRISSHVRSPSEFELRRIADLADAAFYTADFQ